MHDGGGLQERGRAVLLLAELLNRLPALPLNDAAVHHYVDFFCSRYALAGWLTTTAGACHPCMACLSG